MMAQALAPRVSPRAMAAFGLALIAALALALGLMMQRTTYDTWGAMLIGPVLFAATLPALARQAAREDDRSLFAFLVLAFVLKLAGAVVRYYVTFKVYEAADAASYHTLGSALAPELRVGNFVNLGHLAGTNFIRVLTGGLYAITEPTRLGGFVFFSWLGFLGLFFFYRAFVLAVGQGSQRRYARLLFLLPSLVFWPSSIGKESWMMFALGIAAFGVARAISGSTFRGLAAAGVGVWLAGIVRPHVAAMIAVALAAAYVMRRPRAETRHLAPVVKAVSVVAIVAVAWLLVLRADTFLQDQGISTSGGLSSTLQGLSARTDQGGSKFRPTALTSPAGFPVSLVTVLFRPTVLEARNAQALATAAEGTFLILLSLVRLRSIASGVRKIRDMPYLAFGLVYVVIFVAAFSGVANFGILARQRVQVLPFFLMFLAMRPKPRDVAHERTT